MTRVKKNMEVQYTLEELQKIARQGKASEILSVGDQIEIIFDGKPVWYDVIGLDAEKLVDPALKHSITIQAHELIEERPFDISDKYGRNIWRTSELRKYLNSEEYKARYAELIPYLAETYKDNEGDTETMDLFFLLSKDEYNPNKTPYEFYKSRKNMVKMDESGYADWHWTRSANRGSAYNVWNVYTSGHVYSNNACYAHRCAPACVIA